MTIKILANDGMDKSAIDELVRLGHEVDANHYEGEDLVRELKIADIVVIRSATKIRKELIDKVLHTKLKLIIRAGVGIDNIDHEYAEQCGIKVRNTPNSSSAAVAELAIGHMFSLARHIGIANVTMRQGEWNKKQYKGIELSGKTLGLIGMGRIACEVAKRACALGMKVVYTDVRGELEHAKEYEFMEPTMLYKESDIISLHIPFDKNVGPTLTKKEFNAMKDGVYIINAARGGVVCEESLLAALESGKVAGAGIDVYEQEPTPNMALLNHPHVSATPHIGASTKEAQKRIGEETIAVIKECLGGLNGGC